MVDTRWLTKREGSHNWFAVKGVPQSLRALLNKSHWLKSLETRDLVIARSRRFSALAEFAREADAARRKLGTGEIMEAATEWRAHVARLKAGDLSHVWDSRYAPGSSELRGASLWAAEDFIQEDSEEIGRIHGPALAATFRGIASGTVTLFLPYVDPWLREGGRRGPAIERSQRQFRSIVAKFAAWCEAEGIAVTIEAVTRQTAGRYATHSVEQGIDPATWNKHCHTLAGFWGWLIKRAGAKENPWRDQSRSVAAARNGERRRSFTDAEVVTLLTGPADAEMQDAMRIGALGGMRLDELYELTVADCAYGLFNIKQSKTPAGIRTFPIHSELISLIDRRCEGKGPAEYLMHEAGPLRANRDRSANMSSRFSKYRRKLAIDDREPGQRHSKVNYNSFRRWFTTKSRQAGIDTAVVDQVTGHEREGMTDGTYSAGASMTQRKACVEAVRLPDLAGRGPG